VVLVTGMSGTGKSSVLAEFARRGHRVVDTDGSGWIVEIPTPDGPEPIWTATGSRRCSTRTGQARSSSADAWQIKARSTTASTRSSC